MSDLFLSVDPPDRKRRRLLTALMLSPLFYSSFGRGGVYPDTQRIVALEWLSVEIMMALGVTPLAVADIYNYRLWVEEPVLPQQVIDVGLRTEPNLELLAELQPSLILYSKGYGPSEDKIKRIAPILGFDFNDQHGKPLTIAQGSVVTLARALGIPEAAERHLQQLAAFMQQAKTRLQPYTQRPLLLFSLLDARHALVLGKNSLFQQVMDELGIENAWRGETSFWGSAIVGIERLTEINDAHALCFDHGNDAITRQVSASPLWQAIPFVRQRRWQRVPAVWVYGGTLAAMRFCRVLEQALEARRHVG
ncbi:MULTISPECIES: Fe(3+)-hydroxamate ABC transporter substrate-binding protein FhuD [unclassified Brenneria]|uniref:Fe(3+)-hydroxamate ABC transporter substrate-binding protein FhuD n=1 Tax=unclassified Brenneria TaxID=2634434 RepID=UPI001551DC71|nr:MULTISPECIES: Fe(3+)-hydroxamate ABC transporter substrate-binding protein FhuD [unclassified Brenneria]MBJ7223251.1 Fe(3+)-hydroxamate ABC transporter substrate-binding protein FhuD [Brenneria sp. L3-3C-1]MEE3644491.1 Fe(3+)-hydroxamate ABC transporter substrate-binding protein FhuD [Brenneria sp. L3_3C_1]MEE3652053.1 Fe(3+)-hydroxamate ABC transporter substrate-binding protein FhuD [Brenneria sp. HEZEL_4_2_4]NPD02013.1 Fe(3+)-hydroxamate ABC transporter substrate-binding protein FhuD [Bren